MPPVTLAETEKKEEPEVSKPTIGIIYPPPEVRSIRLMPCAQCLKSVHFDLSQFC